MTPKIKDYDVHPAANLFPMMDADALKELAADIKEHGLVQPITVHQRQVLDGRNRLVACQMAGVAPKFADWTGTGSPTAWVISVNLHRRNLTQSQKAAIAFEVLSLYEAEAKERQAIQAKINQPQAKVQNVEIIPPLEKAKARDKAAESVGVNPRYISDVKAIAQERPEMVEKIKAGEITIPAAKKEIAESKIPRQQKHQQNEQAIDSNDLSKLKSYWRQSNRWDQSRFLQWIKSDEAGTKTAI
jgi:ParB-like chromosome segregation protein Spo0J